jgi:hypothetical protein
MPRTTSPEAANIIAFPTRQQRDSRNYLRAVEPVNGVREIPLYHMAKAMDDKPMLEALDAQARRAVIQSEKEAEALRKAGWKPTLGERVVEHHRRGLLLPLLANLLMWATFAACFLILASGEL